MPKRSYTVKDKMNFKLIQNELKYQLEHGKLFFFIRITEYSFHRFRINFIIFPEHFQQLEPKELIRKPYDRSNIREIDRNKLIDSDVI